MTIETAPSPATVTREPGAHALVEIAYGLANGARTLVPSATAAVVVAIGSEWQLLAQAGPLDIANSWPAAVANQVRDSDLPQQHDGYLLAPFSAIGLHALLIVAAASSDQMPRRTHALLQPLLDAGGILLDRALAVQERDRAVRRVVRLCRHESSSAPHTVAEVELSVASLWPGATARFHDPSDLFGACWSSRRLVRTACDLDQPSVGRTPAYDGLMPLELTYLVALPVPSQDGAILVEVPAGGEELDTRSLATAIAMTRDMELAATTDARSVARHA
jgi:hypothetical protein